MSFKDKLKSKKQILATCVRDGDFPATKPGLAYTPAQMMKLAERGVPISSANIDSHFFDGQVNPAWDIPLERQRGIDVSDIWQAQREARSNLRKARADGLKQVRAAESSKLKDSKLD